MKNIKPSIAIVAALALATLALAQQDTAPQADEYITVLRKADGSTALEFNHLETISNGVKRTLITYGEDQKAILHEDLNTGVVTLHLPGKNATYRAPKPKDKEPLTNVNYFTMVYANAASQPPKKKKPNLLGAIAGGIVGGAAQNLGGQLINNAILSGLGHGSAPALMSAAVQNMGGYMVQQFAWELGRAVMTSSKPTEAGGPERVNSTVTVDKKVFAETNFKGRKTLVEADFAFDSAAAKEVSAKDLYKEFSNFFASGLPKGK